MFMLVLFVLVWVVHLEIAEVLNVFGYPVEQVVQHVFIIIILHLKQFIIMVLAGGGYNFVSNSAVMFGDETSDYIYGNLARCYFKV